MLILEKIVILPAGVFVHRPIYEGNIKPDAKMAKIHAC